MSRIIPVLLLFFIFPKLPAQEPNAAAAPASATVQVSGGPGAAFVFGKVDDNVLAQADLIDAQFERQGVVLHDPVVQRYIDSVGERVLGGRPAPEKVTYRFLVLRDPEENAFAAPNGSVYITTGLLAMLEDEAQLASVLAHETAHVYERHPYIENRSIRRKTLASEIIAAAVRVVPGGYLYGLAVTGAADAANLMLVESIYGYSREMESQADHDGLAAMTAAGYDPRAMAVAFELLDQDRTLEYEPRPTFFHDHPKLKAREGEALAFADSVSLNGLRSGSKQEYLNNVAPAIVSSIKTDLESRRQRMAVARATRLVNAFPFEPQYKMLLGESWRALGAKTALPTADELTEEGKAEQRKQVLGMTEEQEQEKLRSTPDGSTTFVMNQAAAERLFLAVIQEQPDYALVYRELGFLYEDEKQYSDAAANYRRYLQLLPSGSLDRLRIERRLVRCQNPQSEQAHP